MGGVGDLSWGVAVWDGEKGGGGGVSRSGEGWNCGVSRFGDRVGEGGVSGLVKGGAWGG